VSTVLIPTRIDGSQRYSFRVSLGSISAVIFGFEFTWNSRDGSWSMMISDSTGNLLFSKKITLGVPMTWRYSNPSLPKGEFLAVDTSGQDQEAGLTDLGSRVLLTFTDAADLP
jgi:hypothetical protein